ncbi:hypothetical protein [uncultured Roseovarius sp.]
MPLKGDRDTNFIERDGDGTTVNRWLSTGFHAAVRPRMKPAG